jgi:uncharacterized protein (TIGR02996 family)
VSEDEALLRAIIDRRGDDTARLVYADWLDERADPRGAFLRAELEWARTGKKEKALRALAEPLDAVWVARVSRPPVGICADQIAIGSTHSPATASALDAAEKELGFALPAEYRALLMNHNGACPAIGLPKQPARFPFGISEVQRFLHVLPAGAEGRTSHEEEWDLVEAVETLCDREFTYGGRNALADGECVPVADAGEGDFYCLAVRGPRIGAVYFFHDFTHNAGDPDHLGIVCKSLGALFASIIETAPEWYRYVKNGDTQAGLEWVDAGGNPNAKHPDSGESVLYEAVCARNAELVAGLVARGAKVTKGARDAAGYAPAREKKKLLAALATKPAAKPAQKPKA